MMSKYQRLKVAAAILGVTMKDICEEADVSITAIKGVADGEITSERLSEFIDQKIKESEEKFNETKKQTA